MKIENLTEEQEKQLEIYRDKYLGIGLSTKRVDKKLAIESAHEIYEKILEKEKVPVVILNNPLDCWIAVNMFCQVGNQVGNQVENQVWSQVRNQVRNQVGSQVENQVWSQVRNQVRNQVGSQVRSQVDNQVDNQVENQVWSQVRSQVRSQVENQVEGTKNLLAFVWPYIDGNLYASFFSFYDFMSEVLNIELCEKYYTFKKSLNFSLMYPLDNICIICDRPTKINMENGKLHCEDGPAVEYEGDFKVYSLNGVRMNGCEWVILDKEPNPTKIMAIKNVEQRLQAIKHVGLNKMLNKLNYEVIDTKDEYELILLNLEGRKCEFLKMINPTTAEVHVEGVPPGTRTVTQAMAWRMNLEVYSNPLAKA